MSEDRRAQTVEDLEEKVSELERVADALGSASEEEVVGMLDRAVGLLKEINAGLESGVGSATEEEREIGEILEGVDFGPFDEALEEIERKDERQDEHGEQASGGSGS